MPFLLSSQNVLQYLANREFFNQKSFNIQDKNLPQIESKICKNFNLILHFSDSHSLLIKQEPHEQDGHTNGELSREWRLHELIQTHSELHPLRRLLSKPIYFDSKHSILISNYLKHYCDLDDFYLKATFPIKVASCLGKVLAEVHRATFNRRDYQQFLLSQARATSTDDEQADDVPDLSQDLERITPDVFGKVSMEGLKFYQLYQRYESLGQAIADLNQAYAPCCLIHNDLKLNNILLHLDWQTLCHPEVGQDGKASIVRLIDWEKWSWGDPAADLGALIASYLKLWLKSLVVQAGIEINLALQLAGIPLEHLQPSIVALTRAYLADFPDVLVHFPDFLARTMQFAGLALIESIQTKVHYREPFGNIEICMLQVAKTLLSTPEQSLPTVFGIAAAQLLDDQEELLIKAWETGTSPTVPAQQHLVDPPESLPTQDPRTHPWQSACTSDAMLQDLVSQIQIRTFWLQHSGYSPPERPEGLDNRLQALPLPLQHQYLRTQWRNYLYDLYFSGELALVEENASLGSLQTVENNAIQGLNLQFYQQIHQSNQGQGYFDLGWQVLRLEQDGTFAVQKEGLTMHIAPNVHLPPTVELPLIGEEVAVRLPSHRMDGDFYVAVGNAGLVPEECPKIELCFNITPTGAIALMQALTQYLNAIQIPFSFKVLSNPDEYGRYDAGILQINRRDYSTIEHKLQQLYQEQHSQFHPPIPLFTKWLAPGLALAEEPDNASEDFGLHRCQLVAEALLTIWKSAEDSPEARMEAIRQHFSKHELDLQRPYLNPGSEDIYSELSING